MRILKYFKKSYTTEAASIRHPIYIRKHTTDEKVYRKIFINKEYELKKLDKEPKFIIDAGAYTGLSAIYFANKYPNANIYCLEPEKSNYEILKENTHLYPNITTLNVALWKEKTQLDLTSPHTGHWAYKVVEWNREVRPHSILIGKVEAISMIELIETYSIDWVDILKMDIEGAEKEVLENASAWIDKVNILLIEIHERLRKGCNEAFQKIRPEFTYCVKQGENMILSK